MKASQTSYSYSNIDFTKKPTFSFIQLANVTDSVEQIILFNSKSLQNAVRLVKVCFVYRISLNNVRGH